MDTKEILERLKDKLSTEVQSKIKDKELAPLLGMTKGALAAVKNRGTIPYASIIKLCQEKGIDLNEIFLDEDPVKKFSRKVSSDTSDTMKIKVINNVYGSCGGGAENTDESFEFLSLDKSIIEKLNIKGINPNIEAIQAVGDSMLPLIDDGDTVLINRDDDNINKSGIFVIRTQDGLFIKRVHKNLQGGVDLISENSVYPTHSVSLEDISILGRVVGLFKAV